MRRGHETAFTTSIEAREGVTTGISAGDRARTVSVAIDTAKTKDDIVTPGHVFPLIARDGGVLVRAGHTEAGVDISRLAGLNPSSVICEIMKDDGTMARMDDLVSFARMHKLKMGTIRDLIAYRMKNDHLVEKASESDFVSDYGGDWARDDVSEYRRMARPMSCCKKGISRATNRRWCGCTPFRSLMMCWANPARVNAHCSVRWQKSAKTAAG